MVCRVCERSPHKVCVPVPVFKNTARDPLIKKLKHLYTARVFVCVSVVCAPCAHPPCAPRVVCATARGLGGAGGARAGARCGDRGPTRRERAPSALSLAHTPHMHMHMHMTCACTCTCTCACAVHVHVHVRMHCTHVSIILIRGLRTDPRAADRSAGCGRHEENHGFESTIHTTTAYHPRGLTESYSKGLSDRNRLAGGSQLISKFLREIEPTVSQFLNVHAFRK